MIRALVLSLLICGAAHAQAPDIPRTPEGKPDFTGVWTNDFLPSMMERIPGATAHAIDDAEATTLLKAFHERRRASFPALYDPDEDKVEMRLPRLNGRWLTTVVSDPPDGKVPLTPEGQKRMDAFRAEAGLVNRGREPPAPGPESRNLAERCLKGPGRPPFTGFQIEQVRRFVQTGDHLVIHTEYISETRIIGIDGARRSPVLASFDGDSVARWEDDVLVIETVNPRPESSVRSPGVIVRPEAKLIERLSFVSPDELHYQFTVEDPLIYARPWMAGYGLKRSAIQTLEGPCHEHNYSMASTLSGAREFERRAASHAASQAGGSQ